MTCHDGQDNNTLFLVQLSQLLEINMTLAFALSPIAQIIAVMYQITKDINNGINNLIDDMKQSENTTISRTGRVLEGAKYGFGVGYMTPVIVVAVGQLLLGNPLHALGHAAVMAWPNPISMTCAAVGAILYGWNALTPQERDETLEKLSKGLEVGIELIKSIVHFVIDKTKEILSSENIEELKKYIGSVAATFGKTLSDVTRKVTDIVSDGYDILKRKSGDVADKTVNIASDAYRSGVETAEKAANTVMGTAGNVANVIREKLGKPTSNDSTKNDTL